METKPKNLNVSLPPGTTVLRLGDAEKVDPRRSIKITGVLTAPSKFLEHKNLENQYQANYCHLLIDKDNNTLTLHCNEKSTDSEDVITGKLIENPQLSEWGINTEKKFTVRDFIKFIRARKLFFTDKSEQDALIQNLQKWNATVDREIKEHNNNTGNSLISLETKVTTALTKNSFSLTIPIYKGYPSLKFDVEIGLDPKATQVDLFLVSPQLYELVQTERDKYFNEALAGFDKLGFQCSRILIS